MVDPTVPRRATSDDLDDHTRSAELLRGTCGCTILGAPEMTALAPWLEPIITGTFPTDTPWTIGDLTIRPHAVAHDEPAGGWHWPRVLTVGWHGHSR